MTKQTFNKDDAIELLSYFIGNPPRLQDARFRELISDYDSVVSPINDGYRYDPIYNEAGGADAANVPTEAEQARTSDYENPAQAKREADLTKARTAVEKADSEKTA